MQADGSPSSSLRSPLPTTAKQITCYKSTTKVSSLVVIPDGRGPTAALSAALPRPQGRMLPLAWHGDMQQFVGPSAVGQRDRPRRARPDDFITMSNAARETRYITRKQREKHVNCIRTDDRIVRRPSDAFSRAYWRVNCANYRSGERSKPTTWRHKK